MPMTDAFGGAESSVDAQRKALLAAVAQQGKAGRLAYDEQVKAAEAARQEAVKAASSRAGAVSAPDALVKQLQQGSSELADRYTRDAAAATTAYDQEQARMTGANATYMDQVRAAIPLSRQVATARKQEAEAARQAALADEQRRRQWEMEDRQSRLADAQRERGWSLEDRAYEESQRKAKDAGVTVAPRNPQSAGKAVGLSPKDVKSITSHEDWGYLVDMFTKGLSAGGTQAQARAALRTWEAQRGHSYPKFEKLLMEMYFGGSGGGQKKKVQPTPLDFTVPGFRDRR